MRSEIKNWTSSCNKARSAFLHELGSQSSNSTLFILKTKLSRRAVPKIKVNPGLTDIVLRSPISEIAQRSSNAKLYTVISAYYYIKKMEIE